MQENYVILNKCPKSMTDKPTEDKYHSIIISFDTGAQLGICFQLCGVTLHYMSPHPLSMNIKHFPGWTSPAKIRNGIPRILTSHGKRSPSLQADEFNPPGDNAHDWHLFNQSLITKRQTLSIAALNSLQATVHSQHTSEGVLNSINQTLSNQLLSTMLQQNQIVSAMSKLQCAGIMPEHLASKWNISLKQACNTIKVTTQHSVHLISNPALSRRFKTNYQMLRYNLLPHMFLQTP